ncbi:CBS-domain-containing membrane protein [Marinobacterium lacunae]|uniref:CBS-domain-containing membrane protein n=1 Tax=Marinobacterium lacunae TaxID=1232683 RepID=A0A081FVD5_9GAMM|nr:HPP family protein [Marinobacterium lacunae]KEA62490.1 CBS-domain-containing membrane protein [Marinobacterium lacunae]
MTRHRLIQSSAPPAPPFRFILLSSLGAGIAIAITGWLSLISGTPWLMAPFGASCVLAFGVPDSPLAQPRAIIGGHLVATLVGLILGQLLGDGWLVYGLGVALALAAMQLTRTVHAPAGADPIIVIAAQAPFSYLISPVLAGSVVIVLTAWAMNNLHGAKSYPRYWL